MSLTEHCFLLADSLCFLVTEVPNLWKIGVEFLLVLSAGPGAVVALCFSRPVVHAL